MPSSKHDLLELETHELTSEEERQKWARNKNRLPTNHSFKIPTDIPEAVCKHCSQEGDVEVVDNFDEHGYIISKAEAYFVEAGREQGNESKGE